MRRAICILLVVCSIFILSGCGGVNTESKSGSRAFDWKEANYTNTLGAYLDLYGGANSIGWRRPGLFHTIMDTEGFFFFDDVSCFGYSGTLCVRVRWDKYIFTEDMNQVPIEGVCWTFNKNNLSTNEYEKATKTILKKSDKLFGEHTEEKGKFVWRPITGDAFYLEPKVGSLLLCNYGFYYLGIPIDPNNIDFENVVSSIDDLNKDWKELYHEMGFKD